MSWTYSYISVGGRNTGAIAPNTWPEGLAVYWAGASLLKTGYIYSTPDLVPSHYAGWDPGADTYPADAAIFKATAEDQTETYIFFTINIDPGNYYILDVSVASAIDGARTSLGSYAGTPLSADWTGFFSRTVDGLDYFGLGVFYPYNDDHGMYFSMLNLDDVMELYGQLEGEETSPEYGPESGPAGYDGGTFDDSSDTIGVPAMPTIGVSSIGFVNVYNPSTGALAQLGEDLFPDFTPTTPYTPTGNTVIDAITDVAEALANIATNIPNVIEMFNNSQLINYIIDCHIIPVTPTVGSSQAIKIGYRTMSQAAPKVSSDYVDCDCGTLQIGEYYRNFIDYGPYTQAKLFLPFVGFVPIEPELFQSGTLRVIYRFNVIDGSFMAFVLSSSSKSKLRDTVIGQWGGNACVHVPITGINYSNMVSGIAAGVSATVAEIGKGSLTGAADAALNTAAAAPALQSSNGYNATTSFLSVRTPYLMIERSVSHYSRDYGHEQGYPSEITADWSKLTGYTESDSIHLEGLGATDEEMKEIASLLAAGVIL